MVPWGTPTVRELSLTCLADCLDACLMGWGVGCEEEMGLSGWLNVR